MPMPDKTEKEAQRDVTLKEFMLGVVNERERKYEQRFDGIGAELDQMRSAIKEAVGAAIDTNAKALASLDRRFETVNEFRAQLADQQATFARRSDVESVMAAAEKATIKSEAATEKRLEDVNEFRAQLSDQQAALARKTEVDIRFDALEKKLGTAVAQLQVRKGHESGVSAVWGVLAVVLALGLSAIGIAVAIVLKH